MEEGDFSGFLCPNVLAVLGKDIATGHGTQNRDLILRQHYSEGAHVDRYQQKGWDSGGDYRLQGYAVR